MPREAHLSSLVVHARPERLKAVAEAVAALGGEVQLTNPAGKLVVTLEADSARALGDALTRMQLIDGVLAATMVFHHCEPAETGAAPADAARTEAARKVAPRKVSQ